MRTIKYHLVLTDNEYSLIINSLNNMRNDLIAQGRYTDTVDDVLVEFIGSKKKNFKIIYQEGWSWMCSMNSKAIILSLA